MFQVSGREGGLVSQPRAMPSMTWHGSLTGAVNAATHHLHIFAVRCAKCNGPAIVGSLGTRQDDISREINIRQLGAICLVCGFKPEVVAEPSMEHRFRPVPWNWEILDCKQTADLRANRSSPECSPETGPKL